MNLEAQLVKSKCLAGVTMGVLALGLAPTLASASAVTFDYSSQSAGNVLAHFTVDVTGSVAQSGFGTISGPGFGSYNLVLLTSSTVLPANNGSINPTPGSPPYDLGSGFTWHGVTGSGGADFLGDAVVRSNPNYLDDYGLIFAIADSNSGAYVGGLNIFANVNSDPTTLYATNLSVNGSNTFENTGNGTLVALVTTAATVPEPSALGLVLLGLGALGFVGSSGKAGKPTGVR